MLLVRADVTMTELVKEYLETSTIHGMVHISTSHRYFRLFWLVVVAGGFLTAGHLISKNIKEWNQHPVITAMETLDISQMTFPNVTICPPRNKFTSLNYDISMIDRGQISLSSEIKENLTKHVTEVAFREFRLQVKTISEMFDREFYNLWYGGELDVVSEAHLEEYEKENVNGSLSFGLVSERNLSVSHVVNAKGLMTRLEISIERNDSQPRRLLEVTSNDTAINCDCPQDDDDKTEARPQTTK